MTAGAFAPAPHAPLEALVARPLTEQQANQAAVSGFAEAAKTATDLPKNPDNSEGFSQVMIWIMSLFAWLVGVAAVTLNYAVYYTVVTMGDYVNNLSAIGVTWRILRDIGNIMLIFGFLFAGIATIINYDLYGWGKKMIPMMLIAAVFLNFSLFISEAIIDTGNLFATQFYTQINGGKLPTPQDMNSMSPSSEGISNKIMGQLGLQTLYDVRTNTSVFKAGNSWIIGFMGILLFIITAFVMFSLAFILIARFVVLIFLIILSPVGFAGLAVPKLEAQAKKWWSELAEQTITAPVLLLTLYIALAVITDVNFLTGLCQPSAGSTNTSCSSNWLGYVSGNFAGFASMMLSFFVAMGLLLAVVLFSKKLSAAGAGWASKSAGALTFGATAWGVNRTLGRGAYFASRGLRQSKTFNKVNALTGRVMTGTLDHVATGSFDIRGSGALKKFPGGGIEAGEAQKGGFVEARNKNIKAHEEEAKYIETAHKDAHRETSSELTSIAQAKKTLEDATRAKGTAEGLKNKTRQEYDAAEVVMRRNEAEVARLSAIDKADRTAGRPSSVGSALRAAQQNLELVKTNFATVTSKLGAAAKDLEAAAVAETSAKKANEAAEKAPKDRLSGAIKASKTAYAEGISIPLNPVTFITYGPDSSAAARKIKESLKEKPTKDKFLDAAKKMAKELEDVEEKSGSEKPVEEKKEEPPKPEGAH